MTYRKPEGLTHAANRKRTAYLRETGQGGCVPAGPVQERIRYLNRERGIPFRVISDRTGVDLRMVKAHAGGFFFNGVPLTECLKRTEKAILSARFSEEDVHFRPVLGTRRRLQALFASGFSLDVIAEGVGVSRNRASAVTIGRQSLELVTDDLARRVAETYRKLETASPADFGVTELNSKRNRNRARRLGYAPRQCWDPDTIDDPEAFPEWTGACGTALGLRIHYRDGIDACERCLRARQELRPSARQVPPVNGARIRQAREAKRMSIPGLAKRLGVHPSSVNYWEIGRSSPRSPEVFDKMLQVLGVTEEDICEGV